MPPKVRVWVQYIYFVVTFNFDFLSSKSDQFISVLNCTEVLNFVKFPQAVHKISC